MESNPGIGEILLGNKPRRSYTDASQPAGEWLGENLAEWRAASSKAYNLTREDVRTSSGAHVYDDE